MPKQLKLKDYMDVAPIKKLSATRYTKKAWMRCYPESNEKEWRLTSSPDSISLFVDSLLIDGGLEDENIPCRVVILDEEYFAWLGNRKNTGEARADYSTVVSDEEAYRLLKKNNLDIETSYLFLPICVVSNVGKLSETTNFNLSAKVRKSVKSQLAKSLDGKVCIAPFLMNVDKLISMSDAEDGEFFDYMGMLNRGLPCATPEKFKTQHYKRPSNVAVLVAPIIVEKRVNTAVIDFDSDDEEFIQAIYPECMEIDVEVPDDCLGEDVTAFTAPPLSTYAELEEMREALLTGLKPIRKSSYSI